MLQFGHVTQAWGRFMVHTQRGSVLYWYTKFKADSKVIRVSKF